MGKTKRRKVNQRAQSNKSVTLAGSSWDMGATGQANRIGLVIEARGDLDPETGKTVNPNAVKGARKIDMMEVYFRRGWISARGFTAGEMLRNAVEDTMRGPGWADNDRVQSSPKPDQAVTMQIDRLSRLVAITKRAPTECARLVSHVAVDGNAIGSYRVDGKRVYLGRRHEVGKVALRVAFDKFAEAIGC